MVEPERRAAWEDNMKLGDGYCRATSSVKRSCIKPDWPKWNAAEKKERSTMTFIGSSTLKMCNNASEFIENFAVDGQVGFECMGAKVSASVSHSKKIAVNSTSVTVVLKRSCKSEAASNLVSIDDTDLTPQALAKMMNGGPKAFLNEYGSHFICGFIFGACLTATYSMQYKDEASSSRAKTEATETYANLGGGGASGTTEEMSEVLQTDFEVEAYGWNNIQMPGSCPTPEEIYSLVPMGLEENEGKKLEAVLAKYDQLKGYRDAKKKYLESHKDDFKGLIKDTEYGPLASQLAAEFLRLDFLKNKIVEEDSEVREIQLQAHVALEAYQARFVEAYTAIETYKLLKEYSNESMSGIKKKPKAQQVHDALFKAQDLERKMTDRLNQMVKAVWTGHISPIHGGGFLQPLNNKGGWLVFGSERGAIVSKERSTLSPQPITEGLPEVADAEDKSETWVKWQGVRLNAVKSNLFYIFPVDSKGKVRTDLHMAYRQWPCFLDFSHGAVVEKAEEVRSHVWRMERLGRGEITLQNLATSSEVYFTAPPYPDNLPRFSNGNDYGRFLKRRGTLMLVETGKPEPEWKTPLLQIDKELYNEDNVAVIETPFHGRVFCTRSDVSMTDCEGSAYYEMLAHVPLCSSDEPKTVLVLLDGNGGVTKEVLRHTSVETVHSLDLTVLEKVKVTVLDGVKMRGGVLDEEVKTAIAMRKVRDEYFRLPLHEYRVHNLKEDHPIQWAEKNPIISYLEKHQNKYDVIILNGGEIPGEPDEGFYEAVSTALRDSGMFSCWCINSAVSRIQYLKDKCGMTAKFGISGAPYFDELRSAFLVAEKGTNTDFIEQQYFPTLDGLKYYNKDVHKAAFMQPPFLAKYFASENVTYEDGEAEDVEGEEIYEPEMEEEEEEEEVETTDNGASRGE